VGDVPTVEVLAATAMLREHLPWLRVRVVNVVDLMRLVPPEEHPHGLAEPAFSALFPSGTPVIFAFHGYPSLIHQLTYKRACHDDFHVHGYKEEGTTTTPFDMLMLNDMDRYRLVIDVIDRVPGLAERADGVRAQMNDARDEARAWTRARGDDIPRVRDWVWPG
jgi:xylulose-5-phosphate/fructose-6-phosphate phosphoketolase